MNGILIDRPTTAPISEREVLRYMGARDATDEVLSLVREAITEADGCFSGRVCAAECGVRIDGSTVDFGFASIESGDLAKSLHGCDRALIFAATVGVEIDRLIAKHSRLSPARALALQALGTERIEAVCNAFCRARADEYAKAGRTLRPRFSAGYGDLSLSFQRDIFQLLDCPRRIGLTLNDSLLMSPTKSVTAIAGVTERKE